MSSPRTEKPQSTPTKPNPAAPSQTELQTQRADWEGMTPSTPQPESENEGEGNRTADRSYREGVKRFIEEGRSEEAAEEAAKAVNREEGEALRRAEQLGKAKQQPKLTKAIQRAKDKLSGRVLVPALMWMAGLPLGIVVLLWFFFFRGR